MTRNPLFASRDYGSDVHRLASEHGLAFVPFFPVGSAFAGGPAKFAADPEIAVVAAGHDATPLADRAGLVAPR